LQAVLNDIELERANRAEERDALGGVLEVKSLNYTFLQELVETFPESFELGGAWTVQPTKHFRWEARNFVVNERWIFREGVADAEFAMADEADDITGICFIDRFAVTPEEFMGTGEAKLFPGPGVDDTHVALEFAGAHANEGETVAVARVHIGLDLEDKTGETGFFRIDQLAGNGARFGDW
jgi:hypothetical protein